MTQLVADAQLPAKLEQVTGEVEIVNTSGRRLGRFIPAETPPEPLIPWDPSITQEELDRRAQEPGGRSLAEILARLEGS